jgi:hypothetical protein
MYPRQMPITSCPFDTAERTTARVHAFIPGASPPLQKTPIRMMNLLSSANDNSNPRVAACLPCGKTCSFSQNGCAALN